MMASFSAEFEFTTAQSGSATILAWRLYCSLNYLYEWEIVKDFVLCKLASTSK